MELDIFRGWAILLMIAYHFTYDLNHFGIIQINMDHDLFWVYARYMIVTMFLLSVGISLALVHTPVIQWKKIRKRTLILGGAALSVSIVTYIQFPHTWVYFGILHFILMASWLGLLFLGHPRLALLTVFVIFLGSAMGWLHTHGLFTFLQAPLHLPPGYTEDIVRIFPWFAVVLIGIILVSYDLHLKALKNIFFTQDRFINKKIAFLGRHALLIYLIHQPILFGLVSLFP